jgi:hypothetical protein
MLAERKAAGEGAAEHARGARRQPR